MKTETEQQTAMQRLIEFINDTQVHLLDSYKIETLRAIRNKAESLLPEERKEIEEAYNLGSARTEYDDGFGMNLTISSEQYFTTKFKQ